MTGSWEGHDTPYHSEHYFHSGYVDLVITGLAGLRPRADDTLEVNPLIRAAWDWFALDDVAYRGRTVSIVWDRDGRHYRRGSGLSVYVDGARLARRDRIGRLTAPLGPVPVLAPVDRPVNFAVNNDRGAYPMIAASFSAPATPPRFLNDGQIWYHQSPPNRWTAAGSGNATDWVELDFGIRRPVEFVTLYFLDDSTGIKPPARFALEQRQGDRWIEIPSQQRTPARPEGRRANTVTFPAIETTALRLTLDSARTIARVELYFVADGGGLAAPRRFEVQAWNGTAWVAAGIRRRLHPGSLRTRPARGHRGHRTAALWR